MTDVFSHQYTMKSKRMLQVSLHKTPPLIDFAAVLSHFSFETFLNIQHAHFHHCLLKIKEEHGLVEGITIYNVSGSCRCKQSLVRSQQSGVPLHCIEVKVIETVSRRVEGLLGIVPGTADFGQLLCKP